MCWNAGDFCTTLNVEDPKLPENKMNKKRMRIFETQTNLFESLSTSVGYNIKCPPSEIFIKERVPQNHQHSERVICWVCFRPNPEIQRGFCTMSASLAAKLLAQGGDRPQQFCCHRQLIWFTWKALVGISRIETRICANLLILELGVSSM